MRFNTNLYEERQQWIQNVQLNEDVWDIPYRWFNPFRQSDIFLAPHERARKKAILRWQRMRNTAPKAWRLGPKTPHVMAAIAAAEVGYAIGNEIGNSDVVQDFAGDIGSRFEPKDYAPEYVKPVEYETIIDVDGNQTFRVIK